MNKIVLNEVVSYRKRLQDLEKIVSEINRFILMREDIAAKIVVAEEVMKDEGLIYQLRGALDDAEYQISIRKKSYKDILLSVESNHRNMLNEVRGLRI